MKRGEKHAQVLEAILRREVRAREMSEGRGVPWRKTHDDEVAALMAGARALRRQPMDERNEVVIPAGILIHVGGFPFRTITDTTVEGTDANLALGLKALDESAHVPTTGEVLGIGV